MKVEQGNAGDESRKLPQSRKLKAQNNFLIIIM
jgi:hypothetical protein